MQFAQAKIIAAVTAQVGPVFKGNLNRGTNGTPVRTGAGAYTITGDGQSLMNNIAAATTTDAPQCTLLSGAGNSNASCAIAANVATITSFVVAAATDIDFILFVWSTI